MYNITPKSFSVNNENFKKRISNISNTIFSKIHDHGNHKFENPNMEKSRNVSFLESKYLYYLGNTPETVPKNDILITIYNNEDVPINRNVVLRKPKNELFKKPDNTKNKLDDKNLSSLRKSVLNRRSLCLENFENRYGQEFSNSSEEVFNKIFDESNFS